MSTEREVGSPLLGQGSIGTKSVTFAADGSRLFNIDAYGLVGCWGEIGARGLIDEPLARGAIGPEPSADGSRVLVAVDGERLEVRDGTDPSRPGVQIDVQGDAVLTQPEYELSADGSTMVAFTAGQSTARLRRRRRDRANDVVEHRPGVDRRLAAPRHLSADGSRVIVADRGWNRLRMWDVATGELAGELERSPRSIRRPRSSTAVRSSAPMARLSTW